MSIAHRKKLSDSHKEYFANGGVNPNKGKKFPAQSGSNHPNWKSVLKFADSFMVFILTALLLIPLIKILLEKYLEPRLSTPYLTWIVLGAVIISVERRELNGLTINTTAVASSTLR